MRKLFTSVALIALMGIAACGAAPAETLANQASEARQPDIGDRFDRNTAPYNIAAVITDKETGCKYLQGTWDGGTTPLLRSDGTPDCSIAVTVGTSLSN